MSLQDLCSAALTLQKEKLSDLAEDFVDVVLQFRKFLKNEKESNKSVTEIIVKGFSAKKLS